MAVQRKITDIEKSIMQTLMKVVLRDLSEAWTSVAKIDFAVQSLASEPQLMHVLAPAEAVIVISRGCADRDRVRTDEPGNPLHFY